MAATFKVGKWTPHKSRCSDSILAKAPALLKYEQDLIAQPLGIVMLYQIQNFGQFSNSWYVVVYPLNIY